MRAALGLAVGFGLAALLAVGPAGAQRQDYGITVVNGTGAAIEYFYYSECRTNDWRSDRLGANEVIQPGASRYFDMYDGITDCCRDMRAKFANGSARERMGVNVCSEAQWVVRP
jgi:hypothetical protein